MPNRKLVVTHKNQFGSGGNLTNLVRMELVEDALDTEAVTLNAGVVSMAITARLSPLADLSGWAVGQKKIVDVNL